MTVFFLFFGIKAKVPSIHSRVFIVKRVCALKFNIPVGIYMFNVNNRNTRIRCEICSCVSNFNFEQVNTGWDTLTLSR